MTDKTNKSVPQIAITAYESNEEDIEVKNLFNATNEKKSSQTYEPRSVSPNPFRHKSRIVLKSPTLNYLQNSISPCLSDLSGHTDVEVMSDSDDEKDYVRTGNLTPGPINYFILTDIEDLSEDEEHGKHIKVKEELTDTEHFTDDKGVYLNEIEQTEQFSDSLSFLPQPHREILFHSKDGTVSAISPTVESNLIGLKTPKEEIKGFESEEEVLTTGECEEIEPCIKNNNTYYHNIDVGVVESVETIKHERYKHKLRNRNVPKKSGIPEIEWGKKRFRNKNRCNSEIEECFEKRSEEHKKNALLKYKSEPTLCNAIDPTQNQNMEKNKIKYQANNNTFVIHDNRNDFSISIDFECNNTVLLNVGRDNGNLSMRWFNNGITAGRVINNYNNINLLEPLESEYSIKNNFKVPKRRFNVDLFTYGTLKTLQNKYITYIIVNIIIQPINIVQLYINRPYQTQITFVNKPLIKLCSLKDKFTSEEKLNPSSVRQLPAFKLFSQKETTTNKKQTKTTFESKKYVSNIIHIFESMCGNKKLGCEFNYEKLPNLDDTLKKSGIKQKCDCLCTPIKNQIGNYQLNFTKLLNW